MPKDDFDLKDTKPDVRNQPIFGCDSSCCEVDSTLTAYRFAGESVMRLEIGNQQQRALL